MRNLERPLIEPEDGHLYQYAIGYQNVLHLCSNFAEVGDWEGPTIRCPVYLQSFRDGLSDPLTNIK